MTGGVNMAGVRSLQQEVKQLRERSSEPGLINDVSTMYKHEG